MPTLRVITLGCSKNTVDTEHLLSQVAGKYTVVPDEGDPAQTDVLLINTCGFIGDAKEESIQTILDAVERKAARKIYVFGCLSQRYPKELPSLIPEVDGWFGARDQDDLVRALGCTPQPAPGRIRTAPGRPYAFLKISEGCDRRCSYCAIPLIRGDHRSVPVDILVSEAEALAKSGVRELVVIAQDTTWYGLDLYRKRALADLLTALSKVEGIRWIRLHYSYPSSFPEDVLSVMAENPKICRYIDIPLQHIADPVLEAMHRGIDGALTRALIRKMREKVPGVVLRTTMMVGHPGEGRKEFNELLDFVREARFERLGAFAYSEEEGTFGARNFRDSVDRRTKQRRLDKLMALQQEISLEANRARIGEETLVLADDFVDGYFVCRSEFESPEVDGEIIVPFRRGSFGDIDPYGLVGTFFKVRIDAASEYDLTAEFVDYEED